MNEANGPLLLRPVLRHEISQVWTIDRSETIHAFYHVENGLLVLKAGFEQVSGWPEGEPEQYTPILIACYDRGGWFYAFFEQEKMLAVVVVVDSVFIGKDNNLLQLKFLHVSHHCRGQGLGQRLFDLACQEAAKRGARGLYISATPTENTINFYLGLGCQLIIEPDQTLFALEPEDIHMQYLFETK